MAYGDNVYSASHQWTFNNTLNDAIGSLVVTGSGTSLVSTAITRDSTHALQTNNTSDLATVVPTAGSTTTGGSTAAAQRAVTGWFQVSAIQGPPCMVYKCGGNSAGFHLFIWAGNALTMQWKDNAGAKQIQIYSDNPVALTSNRAYHFAMVFSGDGFDDEVKFYIDGVKQTRTGTSVVPSETNMDGFTGAHNWGANGSTGEEVDTGDETVLTTACVNGFYSQWWWFEGVGLTDNDIRENIFAPGAIAEVTISSSTEAGMQAQLDLLSGSEMGDYPLSILVEEIDGTSPLDLSANGVTFNSRASIHVRYDGSGSLNWTNNGGGTAVSGSGNVTFLNPFTLTLNNLQNPTEVRVYEAGTQTEVAGAEAVTGGSFADTISVSSVDIRLYSLTYEILVLESIAMTSNISIDVQQFIDRQYSNN